MKEGSHLSVWLPRWTPVLNWVLQFGIFVSLDPKKWHIHRHKKTLLIIKTFKTLNSQFFQTKSFIESKPLPRPYKSGIACESNDKKSIKNSWIETVIRITTKI